MKQILFMLALVASAVPVRAQMTREIAHDRVIPPYGLEVGFCKTTHVIFPSGIRYVDLGSPNLIAGKADGVENVLRIKAAIEGFERETNFSVITEEGSFYSFNVKYVDEPEKLNVEMKDFIRNDGAVDRLDNTLDIHLPELGDESPRMVNRVMKSIHKANRRAIGHIVHKHFGVQYRLKGIYVCNGLFYFHTELKNTSHIPFEVDFFRMKIVDKKPAKRTAIQETAIQPVRAYNNPPMVDGKKTERTVFVTQKFTIPDSKKLVVELYEKNGGRHLSFEIENSDLVKARTMEHLEAR